MAKVSSTQNEIEFKSIAESTKVIAAGQNITTPDTTDEVDARHARSIALWVLANGPAVSAGVVLLEGAPYSGYTGTWVTLGTVTVTIGGPKAQTVNVNSSDDGMPCAVVRARISTKIANGNIDAYIIAQS